MNLLILIIDLITVSVDKITLLCMKKKINKYVYLVSVPSCHLIFRIDKTDLVWYKCLHIMDKQVFVNILVQLLLNCISTSAKLS